MASEYNRLVREFRNSEIARRIAKRLATRVEYPVQFMEVCGTHTVSIFKHGLRQLLPQNVTMLSGPGCPVCVTTNADIDKAVALTRRPDVILTTFGDMLKVPGSQSSLQQAKAEGGDVRMVYSTLDALRIAQNNPTRSIVFFAVGFETTAPTIAASILEAERLNLTNYYIISVHKLIPPAMKLLLDSGEVRIDGFLCPGHVSTIIGSEPYDFLVRDYGIPCVVAGFEPLDILQSVDMLLQRVATKTASVEIEYSRGVRPEGNKAALDILYRVFEVADADWRGLGTLPASGLKLRANYRRFDAEKVFDIEAGPTREHAGCKCGDVLRGAITPAQCPLFGRVCTPDHPVGPCMVSSEGTCSTWHQYGGLRPDGLLDK